MAFHYPLFYYSGNRFSKSDKPFIRKHLECLSPEAQKHVSEIYGDIYRKYFNNKEYSKARYYANKYLQEFTKLNWSIDPRSEEQKGHRLEGRIEEVKQAGKRAKPKIEFRGKHNG